MPRSLGSRLPAELRTLLDGTDLASHEGLTILLITTAEDGWPHVAMLSVGEVLARDERHLTFALWPGSQTTANLSRPGAMSLLMVVHEASAYYLRLRCRRLADASVKQKPRALFSATLEDALQDIVDYARITSGIDFRLENRDQGLAAWAAAVEVMRAAGGESG